MSQAGAALGAAVFQNLSAGCRSHTFHEAVFTASLAFFRLVSLFRHG